jgi:prevent-host-death family protein
MATTRTKAETKTRARKKAKQFLVDEKGRRTAVLLPIEEYDRLVEAEEDLADIRAADEARAESGEDMPLEEFGAEGKLA